MRYSVYLILAALVFAVQGQDYFLDSIDCYVCEGLASNSSCADPFTKREDLLDRYVTSACDRGACLKRYYQAADGTRMIVRTCTNDIDFDLPLVHNICQKESNGIGYLCMCGRRLCNSGEHNSPCSFILYITISSIFTLVTLYGEILQ